MHLSYIVVDKKREREREKSVQYIGKIYSSVFSKHTCQVKVS